MQKLLHNPVVSICGCWWFRNYGLLQSPDDGESPHPWSGIAVVCYTQWVTLTQILLSLTGLLSACKPGNEDILQIMFQYNANKNLVLGLSLSIQQKSELVLGIYGYSLWSVTERRKIYFLPTSQIYKRVYYPTQTLLFKPVLAWERRSDFAKRLLKTLKLNFSSYLKTSLAETLFEGNHKRRKQQLQCRMFVRIEGMWWYHFGMRFLSQVFVLVVGMSLS